MTQLEIQQVVQSIVFDEWDEDQVFSEQEILDALLYDNTVPNIKEILPEDYKWYMKNIGELGIDVRNVSFLVEYDHDLYLIIDFIGLVEPVEVYQQYRYLTCTGDYAYRLEDITDDEYILDTKFLPISLKSAWGEVLLMDIKDSIGSIWYIPDQSYCEKYNIKCKEPFYVAENFTEFLKLHLIDLSYEQELKGKGFQQIGEKGSGVWKRI